MKDKFLFSVVSNGVVFYRAFNMQEPLTPNEDIFSLWTTDVSKAMPVSIQFVQWFLNVCPNFDEYHLEIMKEHE